MEGIPSTATSSIPTATKTMRNNDGKTSRSNPSSSSRRRAKSKKSKKAWLNEATTNPTDSASHPYAFHSDPLTTLPLELLGEILVRTHSTRDVLTVALCSKHLWKTLTGPPATFIWKRTRQVAVPQPLPDPPVAQRLSEHAYAAMVYGGGLCEFCKEYTKEMYASFALKLRVCRTEECRRIQIKQKGFTELRREGSLQIILRTPMIEANTHNLTETAIPHQYWPNASLWCRSRDAVESLREYNTGRSEAEENGTEQEFQKQHKEAIEKNNEWMEFCVNLHKWKAAYQTLYSTVKSANDKAAKEVAKSRGYKLCDLLNCTSFGTLHRIRTRCLEAITAKDFCSMVLKTKEELAVLAEKRKLSERGCSYETIREAIEKHYQQLRSESPAIILPPFATFRRLPTLASLLTLADSDTSKSIQDILKKNSVRDIIKTELVKWENDARKQMAARVGYPDWTPVNEMDGRERQVHPLDRVTGWFLCDECTDRAARFEREIQPLTFANACAHKCSVHQGGKKNTDPWDTSKFIKDDKAIVIAKKFLKMCEADETLTGWTWLNDKLRERRFKCLSCKPFSILTFEDMIVHCHRHDDMEIASTDDKEIEEKFKPLQPHLDQLMKEPLLAQTLMNRGAEQRDTKDCGCRHCLFDLALKSTETDARNLIGKLPKMSINGLRSHLKAKHGFVTLRNEDIFTFPAT